MKSADWFFVVAIVVLIGVPGCVGPSRTPAPSAFPQADASKGRYMSSDEFARDLKKNTFEKIDVNRDGIIDRDEWSAVDHAPNAQKHFADMDQNNDEKITHAEFFAAFDQQVNRQEMFTTLDRNRDGSLAPDEFTGRPAFQLFSVPF